MAYFIYLQMGTVEKLCEIVAAICMCHVYSGPSLKHVKRHSREDTPLERTQFVGSKCREYVSCDAPSHQRTPLIRTELFSRRVIFLGGGGPSLLYRILSKLNYLITLDPQNQKSHRRNLRNLKMGRIRYVATKAVKECVHPPASVASAIDTPRVGKPKIRVRMKCAPHRCVRPLAWLVIRLDTVSVCCYHGYSLVCSVAHRELWLDFLLSIFLITQG